MYTDFNNGPTRGEAYRFIGSTRGWRLKYFKGRLGCEVKRFIVSTWGGEGRSKDLLGRL